MRHATYISEDYTAFLIYLGLIIIVDLKAREQYLILICCERPLEWEISAEGRIIDELVTCSKFFLGSFRIQTTLLYKRPKSCVIEIVNVA